MIQINIINRLLFRKELKYTYQQYLKRNKYQYKHKDVGHICKNNAKIIYCDNLIDIFRCEKCGYEWIKTCELNK